MLRYVRALLATLAGLALLLFVPAGTLDWPRGLLFFAVFSAGGIVGLAVLLRVNPEVVEARMHVGGRGTKRWDVILMTVLVPSLAAIVPVAALDDGRFHRFPVPWWVSGLGYVLFLVGFAGCTWVEAVNKFAAPSVRIQTERGHTVVSNGPYTIVRHPLYTASFPLIVGTALALGSLWALIPAGICYAVLILRTHWEDQTLQAELPGYKEYAQRVRFKLLVGVW